MAFVVEDGTGLSTATSFVSVAEADTYFSDRASTAWAALDDTAKQAALVTASEYVSTAFEYIGNKVQTAQALAWPRVHIDPNGLFLTPIITVPVAVKVATYRIAFEIAVNGVNMFASVSASDLISRVKAGSVEVAFSDSAMHIANDGRPSFPWMRELLKGYSRGGSGMSTRLMRV